MTDEREAKIEWAAKDCAELCRLSEQPVTCVAEFMVDLWFDQRWKDAEVDAVTVLALRLMQTSLLKEHEPIIAAPFTSHPEAKEIDAPWLPSTATDDEYIPLDELNRLALGGKGEVHRWEEESEEEETESAEEECEPEDRHLAF